jgi:hypothetical protein
MLEKAEAALTVFTNRRKVMQTYRFRLETDAEFPRFKRLRCENVEVSLKEVLTQGAHPLGLTTDAGGGHDFSMVCERLVQEANDEKHFVPGLAELGYCSEIPVPEGYCLDRSKLDHMLRSLTESIFYVERLSYGELLDIARQALTRKWDHELAKTMLRSVLPDFNGIRDFLRSRDKKIRLSGYGDLDRYALDRVVSPEDFANHEKAVIRLSLPTTNFRSPSFLSAITTGDGKALLSLLPRIWHFQILWKKYPFRIGAARLTDDVKYDCVASPDSVRFVPFLPEKGGEREAAKAIARDWRVGNGKFRFFTPIEKVEEMLQDERCEISFPSINYLRSVLPVPPQGVITEEHIPSFGTGKVLTQSLPNRSLRHVLRRRGMSMTGRKNELLEKVAVVLCDRYNEMLPSLDEHFRKQKYLRIPRTKRPYLFPCVEKPSMIERTVLAMYILKHLRGNTLLDAGHENDTYELQDLAGALLRGEVTLSGNFVAVGGSRLEKPSEIEELMSRK